MSVRVRYAPSPTGSPHVGNIRTAIFNWLYARKMGGVFIARLEDTDRDPERFKPEFISHIEESLIGLGIEPDEWWKNGDPGEFVQSERLALYRAAAKELIEKGFAYPCFCTAERLTQMRIEQQARGVPSGYDRRCRKLSPEDCARYLSEGLPHTVRLAVPQEGKTTYRDLVYGEITFENKLIDDQVLLKSSGWPTYHLAVVVDDHAMRITHVIRGEDWQPSTPKQILLYQALGWEQPAWVHVPLIIGRDRKKLSKRHGSTKFVEFLQDGYLPEALFNFLVLCGWSAGDENRELFSQDEIVQRFSLEHITKSPAVFDYDKLKWMNGDYIRSLTSEDLFNRCLPHLVEAGFANVAPTAEERQYLQTILPLVAERMKLLNEVKELSEYFFRDPELPEEKGRKKWFVGDASTARLTAISNAFQASRDELTLENSESLVNSIALGLGEERPPVIHTLRLAVTGRTVGPGLFELLTALGRETVVRRLETAIGWLKIE